MSQYEAKCDNNCGTQLSEDVHIHCLSKDGEEMTFCTTCRDDLWVSLKEEGWICCDEDCEQIKIKLKKHKRFLVISKEVK